jgi:hypothetical protein
VNIPEPSWGELLGAVVSAAVGWLLGWLRMWKLPAGPGPTPPDTTTNGG